MIAILDLIEEPREFQPWATEESFGTDAGQTPEDENAEGDDKLLESVVDFWDFTGGDEPVDLVIA
jgi:hypothetical protein